MWLVTRRMPPRRLPPGRGGPHPRKQLIPGDGPLSRVPPAAAFLGILALFALAILVGGTFGGVLLGLMALGVGILLGATWSRLSTPDRILRVFVLGLLVAIALERMA